MTPLDGIGCMRPICKGGASPGLSVYTHDAPTHFRTWDEDIVFIILQMVRSSSLQSRPFLQFVPQSTSLFHAIPCSFLFVLHAHLPLMMFLGQAGRS